MHSLLSLPGEIFDLVLDHLQPCDLKNLRLTARFLRDQVGYNYLRHVVLTLHPRHLEVINAQLESTSLARCVKQITIDCRRLQQFANLTRIVYKDDVMQLILQNHDHIGERYCKLASEFLDIVNKGDDLSLFLETLITILNKLPNLRRVTVFEQTHYVDSKPIPHFIAEEVKALSPLLASATDDKLTKRLISLCALGTRLVTRTVILAAKKSNQRKCSIEIQTLYARYGDGGGPTVSGLSDILQHASIEMPQSLVKKIWQHRKQKGFKATQYDWLHDGSPVLLVEGCKLHMDSS